MRAMSARATINIGGVPPDVTRKEFTRWFLFAEGFEGASISTAASGNTEHTATFSSTEAAEWAVKVLNGRQLESAFGGGVVQLSAELPQVDSQERAVHVRFRDASTAKVAVECLNGTTIQDLTIAARLDPDWADQTQLIVTGVGTSISDAELWEYFSAAGEVVQCGATSVSDAELREDPAAGEVVQSGATSVSDAKPREDSASGATVNPLVPPPVLANFLQEDFSSARREVAQCGAPATTPATTPETRTSSMLIRNLSVVEQEVQAAVGLMEGFMSLQYEVSEGKAVAVVRFGSQDACAKAIEVLRVSAFPSTPNEPIDCDYLRDGEAKQDDDFLQDYLLGVAAAAEMWGSPNGAATFTLPVDRIRERSRSPKKSKWDVLHGASGA